MRVRRCCGVHPGFPGHQRTPSFKRSRACSTVNSSPASLAYW
ncbi:hypothetical protein HRUBRA_00949 [Pseudohaliea rubra DSM 19751]|uniref:Uncharacterized protein n=1 Tax=Pseudohaliea rubra DSM 19751 TaxID=1265313 RepID=A0A095X0J7_9GAMM|nr:hypothetical protein HRUBRA_00949 [Pseudohaliea rubra DSM 19751]